MKKTLLLLLLLTIYPNLVNAQITKSYNPFTHKDYFYSEMSMPFNESLLLKYSFKYDQSMNYDDFDENFSLEIKLDPVNPNEKTEEIITERNFFTYSIDNYCNNKKGDLSYVSGARNRVYPNGKFSVYGDNESGYEMLEHYDHYASGSTFEISYYSSPSNRGPSFGKDLFYAIKNNAIVCIKIPYTTSYRETEPKYFTFWLTKELLSKLNNKLKYNVAQDHFISDLEPLLIKNSHLI